MRTKATAIASALALAVMAAGCIPQQVEAAGLDGGATPSDGATPEADVRDAGKPDADADPPPAPMCAPGSVPDSGACAPDMAVYPATPVTSNSLVACPDAAPWDMWNRQCPCGLQAPTGCHQWQSGSTYYAQWIWTCDEACAAGSGVWPAVPAQAGQPVWCPLTPSDRAQLDDQVCPCGDVSQLECHQWQAGGVYNAQWIAQCSGKGRAGLLGINANISDPMVTPQALAAAGVNRVRVELALANPPKTVDYTSPGFSGTEALFAQALEEYAASIQTFKSAGFGILLLLDYHMANDYQGYDEDDARWAIYRAVFKDRATRAAQRLLGMIDAYEIWNEPDALGHIPCGGGCGSYPTCVGGPCPTAYGRYIDLLEDGIDAVRTVDPGAFVLSGVATPDYYAAVKAAASPTTTGLAALQKLDAFNLHPYNTWPGACVGPSYRCDTETRQGNANYLVTELQKLEDTVFDPTDLPRRPVWFTEWGRQTSKVAGCDWQDASDLIGAFFDAMSAPNADTGLVEQAYFFQWVESSSAASLVDTKGAHATPPYQQNYDAFRKGATTLGY